MSAYTQKRGVGSFLEGGGSSPSVSGRKASRPHRREKKEKKDHLQSRRREPHSSLFFVAEGGTDD